MKNSKTLFRQIREAITIPAEAGEKDAMVYRLLEKMLHLSRAKVMSGTDIDVPQNVAGEINAVITRLNRHEPLHYILGEAYFYSRSFYVNPSVLIPRPETELLVETVLDFCRAGKNTDPLKIIDLGTGSGAIPVTLKAELPSAEVFATDVSHDALAVARQNAERLGTRIEFMYHNILQQQLPYGMFNVVVSNPPYVTEKERETMESNVLNHEPELALFVPDDDPLLFYKAIVRHANPALVKGGLLAVEINEKFGSSVKRLFDENGFSETAIVKDLSQKDRIVTGKKQTLESAAE